MTLQQLQKQNQILKTKVNELTGKLRLYAKRPVKKPVVKGVHPPTISDAEYQDIWRKTAGSLKGKLPKDLVAWQRKIRAEWDRDYECTF